MAGQLLSALIDEEAVLILRLWCCAVFTDIELEKLNSFGFKFYEAVSISFA